MSSHVYHEIFLHLNWHTKHDQPLLRAEVEEFAHKAIEPKCRAIKGVHLKALGGTDDHIHVALTIEPFVTISDMVQELKGFSSYEVNRRLERKVLDWQRGYGVVSFGRAHLDWVINYCLNQREHHARNQLEARLEACDEPQRTSPAEAG